MTERRSSRTRGSAGTDMLAQLKDELELQAWLAGAELRHPSLKEVSLRQEVDALARLRDELRLQLHLGKLEAKDEFQHLEGRWQQLKTTAAQTASDAAESLWDLLREIRDGYRGMRSTSTDEEPTPA